jgi:hypothetical protein
VANVSVYFTIKENVLKFEPPPLVLSLKVLYNNIKMILMFRRQGKDRKNFVNGSVDTGFEELMVTFGTSYVEVEKRLHL